MGSLAASPNYAVTYRGADLTVTARPVTLAGTRVYDAGTAIAGGLLTAGNLVAGDTVAVSGIGLLAARDVGTQALTGLSGLTLSNPNYTLAGATGTVAITPATLTYAADPVRRSYGAGNPALAGTVTGLLGADTLAEATTGTAAFTTGAGPGSNVGRYAVTGGGLASGNYVFVQAAGNATALAVDPALLTVTGTKTYDATAGFGAGQLTVTGGVNGGESVALTAGAGTTASAEAGSYAGAGLTGLGLAVTGGNGSAANYTLPATAALTITPATLTVAGATGIDKVYDATTALPAGASGYAVTGLLAVDAGRVAVAPASAVYDAVEAGARTVRVTGLALSGAGAGNYVLAATAVTGTGTIAPRALVVTADAQSRLYGEANPPLTYTLDGLVGGDGLAGALATAAGAASGVGRYAITMGSLAASPNYAVTYRGADLTVAPRPVTLAGTRVYDAGTAIAGGLLTAGNLVTGDTVAVSGTGLLAARDVGTQALTGLSGLALSNPNYTLAGATGAVTITPATLTYAADPVRRPYGAANPALTGTVTGLLGPDTLAEATTGTATFTTGAGPGSNVGGYAVTGAGLAARNYVFAQAAGNASALTVDPAPLTVTGTKTYDATAGFRAGRLTVTGGGERRERRADRRCRHDRLGRGRQLCRSRPDRPRRRGDGRQRLGRELHPAGDRHARDRPGGRDRARQ